MASGVALSAAGSRESLLHRLAGEHAEGARDAGVELHLHDPAGRLGADELVVVGLTADHRAEAGDTGEATRARRVARPERPLEGPGNVEHLDIVVAGLGERGYRSRDEAPGELLVEPADRDRVGVAHGSAGPSPGEPSEPSPS